MPSSRKKFTPAKKGHAKNAAKHQTHQIRIISGSLRGRKITVVDKEGLRPTTDRLRETLFNWLIPYIQDTQVLDMFAGSGALGIEAVSRGACHCTFIEKDKTAAKRLAEVIEQFNIKEKSTVFQKDTLTDISMINEKYDLVFIDPPFGKGMINTSIEKLLNNQLLNDDALIYVESENQNEIKLPSTLQVLKRFENKSLVAMLLTFKGYT